MYAILAKFLVKGYTVFHIHTRMCIHTYTQISTPAHIRTRK